MSAIRQTTKEKPRTVFYIDVDNTLLDNDHIKDKIKAAWELMATGTKTLSEMATIMNEWGLCQTSRSKERPLLPQTINRILTSV